MNPIDRHRAVLGEAVASIPGRNAGDVPLFSAPWQTRVFALVVGLVQRGHFPWGIFQKRLVAHVKEIVGPEEEISADLTESRYFEAWLAATEETLIRNGFCGEAEIADQISEIRRSVAGIRAAQMTENGTLNGL